MDFKINFNNNKFYNNTMKTKIDWKLIIGVIVYIVIIAIAWGSNKNTIDNNCDDISENKVQIETLKSQSIDSRLQIKGLSTKMEYMIELQKEMNQTLKDIGK